MRTEVTKRIFELIGYPGNQYFCSHRWFQVAVSANDLLKKVLVLNKKTIPHFQITDLDLQSLTDSQLTEFYELVVRRFYTQM